ncbi:MAG TPA: sulfotransferase [Pirellulaceae bacterium]|nr:sulfotransferase [Pirellulaceae bacterium]
MSSLPITEGDRFEAFRVPWARHVSTRIAGSFPRFWIGCGNLESALLADLLAPVSIQSPIYIAGLARCGSTVLLETVAHYGVASHRYRDFPFVFTPYWWNRFLDRAPRKPAMPKPRVHGDGLVVSSESPEALEEPLWMAFFPAAHDPRSSQVLDASTDHPAFAAFYRNHLRKLLLVRSGDRYACKANYHVARLEYLLKLFPDARFVVPIRRPRDHVASLMKQHELFAAGEARYPRALAQMRACGHFEFGLDRRVINLGDDPAVAAVEQLWSEGEEARGWARYWSQVYGFLSQRLAANAALRRAALVVRYEDLCGQAEETVRRVSEHCQLPIDKSLQAALAGRLHTPTYYRPTFSAAEAAAIEEETCEVASRFGYRRAEKKAA